MKTTLRAYKTEDWPYVLALHVSQEQALGRTMDLPDLAEEPVINAVVGETDGVITHALFIEAEFEACMVGRNPFPANLVQEAFEKYLMPPAIKYKIRVVRAFVPVQALEPSESGRESAVERIMKAAEFTRENQTVAGFFRLLPASGMAVEAIQNEG